MNLGQTMLTILALVLLALVSISYFSSVGRSGQTLNYSKSGLTATTIATSYIERAQNMSYDEKSATGFWADTIINNPTILTSSFLLGRDGAESIIDDFNDFDDFNGYTDTCAIQSANEKFAVRFDVYYVNPNDIESRSSTQTFVKRMDLDVWRTFPPIDTTERSGSDTVRISTVLGYFKFN
jgi:hypothetical protein